MKEFMDKDFLLDTPTAKELYHDHAERLPIIDYHCHLDPRMVADDHRFRSITELWLGGDHYKWRAMRTNGVAERFVTGDATDWEKFEKWAETMPYCLRNPLYHWTHLELRTAFGIDLRLSPDTAREIYDECNRRLSHDPEMTARGLMRRYRVEVVCTTDDPADSLADHRRIATDPSFEIKVLPTWRPDKAMAVETGTTYLDYLKRLSKAAGVEIHTFSDLVEALTRRHDFFASVGCRLSDHGLSEFYADDFSEPEIAQIFSKALDGREISEAEVRRFKSKMLLLFSEMDAEKGWTQQFHYGTIRNANTKLLHRLGPDTGFDSIGQWPTALSMARFLDRLNTRDRLAKTILYNLNPADNEMVATMIGDFQDGSVAGKMQFGSGWWFNDQLDGMTRQINALSNQGLLSRFVGMLTDSRSFLSYPRHEYFRRCLCNIVGTDVERGLVPFTGAEQRRVCQMVEDISYYNAKRFFNF